MIDIQIEIDDAHMMNWLELFPQVMQRLEQQKWEFGAYMDYSAYLEPDISGANTWHLKPRISGKRIPNLARSLRDTQQSFINRFMRRFMELSGFANETNPGTMAQFGRAFVQSMGPTVEVAKKYAPVEFGFHRRTIKASAKPLKEVRFRPINLKNRGRKTR